MIDLQSGVNVSINEGGIIERGVTGVNAARYRTTVCTL